MTADEVKEALKKRHPAVKNNNGFTMLDSWTCFEEWMGIDLLALSAYENPPKGARTHVVDGGWGERRRCIAEYPIIGYEVKVSRGDYRRELLNPDKRRHNRERCHEWYMAVPKGLLTPEEIKFVEPPEFQSYEAFFREPCRSEGCLGGKVYTHSEPVTSGTLSYSHRKYGPCPTCKGRNYVEKSLVEKTAPTLWVPADMGLIEIDGRGAKVTKPSPVVTPTQPLFNGGIGVFARYVSLQPDKRHEAVHESDLRRREIDKTYRAQMAAMHDGLADPAR